MGKKYEQANRLVEFFASQIPSEKLYATSTEYARLACIDDDIFSAYLAAKYYHIIKNKFGYFPKVDAIGGFGPMSSRINPKQNGQRVAEADMLVSVLLRLGVRKEDVGVVCREGTNTGANLAAYAQALRSQGSESDCILFCVTERLAGRMYLTQICQQPSLCIDYVWRKQKAEEICQLYNGKALGGGLPYLSEAASIYDRYVRYTTGSVRFMASLDRPLPPEVVSAGEELCKRYKLKMPGMSLLKLWQFLKVYISLICHKKECTTQISAQVEKWRQELAYKATH